jgi:hypothetical protein
MYAPAIHFYTFDPSSALDVTDAGVPCVAWTLCAGVPSVIETLGGTGTWSACHEPGTGWDWARSARVPSDTGTRVLGKSVTLQVPFWHCVHHGSPASRGLATSSCAVARGGASPSELPRAPSTLPPSAAPSTLMRPLCRKRASRCVPTRSSGPSAPWAACVVRCSLRSA